MRLCTWNSRGDPTTNSQKRAVLQDLCRRNDVVLIQECGRMSNFFQYFSNLYIAKVNQAGAFNSRCSTAIVSREFFYYDTNSLQSSTGRSSISATFGQFTVMTLHAESGTGADVYSALQKYPSFILGADMNCTPEEMNSRHTTQHGTRGVQAGSTTRGSQLRISHPNVPTLDHSQKILDYFIHTPDIICRNTERYHANGGSDHFPVETEICQGFYD